MMGLKVLVVEDEGIIALLLEDMLAELGHDMVASAANIEDARAEAANRQIDLAILDVKSGPPKLLSAGQRPVGQGHPLHPGHRLWQERPGRGMARRRGAAKAVRGEGAVGGDRRDHGAGRARCRGERNHRQLIHRQLIHGQRAAPAQG